MRGLRHLRAIPGRTWLWLSTADGLSRDLRYAFRTLRKNPGLTAVALISLAVGIGANTAIFSAVNAILVRDTPFRAPETSRGSEVLRAAGPCRLRR